MDDVELSTEEQALLEERVVIALEDKLLTAQDSDEENHAPKEEEWTTVPAHSSSKRPAKGPAVRPFPDMPPIFDLFDEGWNVEENDLNATIAYTHKLTRDALSDPSIMSTTDLRCAVFPYRPKKVEKKEEEEETVPGKENRKEKKKGKKRKGTGKKNKKKEKKVMSLNALKLQKISAAVHFRRATTAMLQSLAGGEKFVLTEVPPHLKLASAIEGPKEITYCIKPPMRDGVYPILYQLLQVSPLILLAQAVDPLVYLHGAEHLRRVRVNPQVAVDVASNWLGYLKERLAPGDHIWVYRLGPMLSTARAMSKAGDNWQEDIKKITSSKMMETDGSVMQVLEFAHVQPHTPMESRLAWIESYSESDPIRTRHVIIEGECTRMGRIETNAIRSGSTYMGVGLVSMRPEPCTLPFFSAPLKEKTHPGDVINELREVGFTLMPSRLGFNRLRLPSANVRSLIQCIIYPEEMTATRLFTSPSWKDAVDVLRLGDTIRLHELRAVWDSEKHDDCTLTVKRSTVSSLLGTLDLGRDSTKDPERGWKKGAEVLVLPQGKDWVRGSIKRAEFVERRSKYEGGTFNLTAWLQFTANALCPDETKAGTLLQLLQVRLDVAGEKQSPMHESMLGQPFDLPPGSHGDAYMSNMYDARLAPGEKVKDQNVEEMVRGEVIEVEVEEEVEKKKEEKTEEKMEHKEEEKSHEEEEKEVEKKEVSDLEGLKIEEESKREDEETSDEDEDDEEGEEEEEEGEENTIVEEVKEDKKEEAPLPLVWVKERKTTIVRTNLLDSVPTHCSQDTSLLWDGEVRALIGVSPSLRVPILNVVAAAGSGKTTAAVAAMEYCLKVHGPGRTVVIAISMTNSAVAVTARRALDVCCPKTARVMRVTAAPLEAHATEADLLAQIRACAGVEDAPKKLRKYGAELTEAIVEMESVMYGKDETTLNGEQAERARELLERITEIRLKATPELLAYKKPNLIALTLDALILYMEKEFSSIKNHIDSARQVFVFIDEASQVPELALPNIARMLPYAPVRVIGDPRQLPPFTLTRRGTNAARFGAALAGSGLSAALALARNVPRLRLSKCRRMHPALVTVPSKLFYEGTMTTHLKPEDRFPPSTPLLRSAFPVTVICCPGKEENAVSGSKWNEGQEALALKVAEYLREGILEEDQTIAILCLYREPVQRMKLSRFGEIEISTVDSAQGDEYDVVIIVTTRSNPLGLFQHIEDARRINVALTRCKRAIFVIGNEEVLQKAKYWNEIYTRVQAEGLILQQKDAEKKMK